MPEISIAAAFLAGLLGGTHCVGMCGGIVAALSLQLPQGRSHFGFHLGYNLGRISTYTIGGAIAGFVGAGSLLFSEILPVQTGLYIAANVMLILLGVYLAGIWYGLIVIERAGGWLWKHLQPLLGKLLPIRSVPRAFVTGMVWGWLPCGLVYSVLVMALASGSPQRGAMLMLAFGLGTLPNLLAMGIFARQLQAFLQRRGVRQVAGLVVAGLGVWGLLKLINT